MTGTQRFSFLWAFLFLCLWLSLGYGKDKAPAHFSRSAVFYSSTLLNVGNISYWIRNDGWSGRNPVTGGAGTLYPRGTAGVVFQDGILWGGWVQDPDTILPRLRVGGQTYRVGTTPGRIISPGVAEDPELPHVRIYRIRKDYQTVSDAVLRRDAAELFYNGDTTQVTAADINAVRQQYETDWNEWPVQYGAPFYDLNGNGVYEPGQGETPGLANADQVIWFVCNDLDPDATNNLFGSPPIGLELQVTVWGYKEENSFLGQAVFKRYRIINKSGMVIDSMYLGQWVDADLGTYVDDLVGCDTSLNIGYAYNGNPDDGDFRRFDLYPPAIGYLLLQGPILPSPGDTAIFDLQPKPDYRNLHLTSFAYIFQSAEEPELGTYNGTLAYYNSLRGYLPTTDVFNPEPYIVGSGANAGQPTNFPLSGDPVSGIGDIDGTGNNLPPRDVRFLKSMGPFTMQPGDTQEVVLALVGGEGTSYHPYSVEVMRLNARAILQEFPRFYRPLHAMPAPAVTAISLNGKVVLNWGKEAELLQEIERDDLPGNYFFEGYKVYQLPRWNAPPEEAVYVTTIDKETPPKLIFGYHPDAATGTYMQGPIILGTNSGIQHFVEIDHDYLTGEAFQDYRTYYFAVTAYRYTPNPHTPFPVVESGLGRTVVRVYHNNPGYQADVGDEVPVAHNQGLSSGNVTAIVVDPAAVTGHTYEVTFDDQLRWSVTDITTGEVKLANQSDLSGGLDFPTVDGIMVSVWSPDSTDLFGWESEGDRWISGVDWGGRQFFGGLDIGERFLGSTLSKEDLVPVRLVFQDVSSVEQEGFWTKGAVYRRDQGYTYAGTGELPMRAFDMIDPDLPRRLNISFVEDNDLAPANLIWDMGWNGTQFPDEIGAREYLFIHLSDYDQGMRYGDGVPFSGDTLWAPGSDVLFAIWPRNRGSRPYLFTPFTLDILVNRVLTPEDVFTYTAPPPPDIPTRLELFQNYPNPFNDVTVFRYRVPQHGRVLMEIYNILGQRVAVLLDEVQNEGQYEIRWEAKNVSSGLYFSRLSAGGKSEVRKILLVR